MDKKLSRYDFTRVCMFCKYYDDIEGSCHLNPPVYAGDREEDGEPVAQWQYPMLGHPWLEWCGQWQAENERITREERGAAIDKLREANTRKFSIPLPAKQPKETP